MSWQITFSAIHPAGHKVYEEQLIVLQETLFHFQEMLSAHQDCQVLSWQFPEIKVLQNIIR